MSIHEQGIRHKEFLVWVPIVVMVFYVVYYDTSLLNVTDSFTTKCDHFITNASYYNMQPLLQNTSVQRAIYFNAQTESTNTSN